MSDEMVARASRGGVVDGASLVCIATEKRLWSWGVRNKISIKNMLTVLNDIRGGVDTIVNDEGTQLIATANDSESSASEDEEDVSYASGTSNSDERTDFDYSLIDQPSLEEVAVLHTNRVLGLLI